MTNPHKRTGARFRPKFPRLQWLAKRRSTPEWITIPDDDNFLRVVPTHRSSL